MERTEIRLSARLASYEVLERDFGDYRKRSEEKIRALQTRLDAATAAAEEGGDRTPCQSAVAVG